jgi:hypothetical protein
VTNHQNNPATEHALFVESYDSQSGMVTYSNPWDTSGRQYQESLSSFTSQLNDPSAKYVFGSISTTTSDQETVTSM